MAKTRPIVFGEIPGIKEGKTFAGRKEMMESSFHRKWGSGIDAHPQKGAAAIVLSGGYEDDDDQGDLIIYTGAGGNKEGKQIADQSWEYRDNAALLVSMDKGLPVRVIRGHQHKSEHSPKSGYIYAGLYSIVDAWEKKTDKGLNICQVKLEYIGTNPNRETSETLELKYSQSETERKSATVLRVVRDSFIANDIKKLYQYQCQVCNETILTKSGRYAEGAHIKPLGKPHNGHDSSDNILCLCPNHHVMFDKGSFSINDDYQFIGVIEGYLIKNETHKINPTNLAYHRTTHGYH